MAAPDGGIDGPGHGLAQGEMALVPLHQGADDMLGRLEAAKVILLGFDVRLVVEDRRMARMGDEVGQVVAFGQMAGEGGVLEGFDVVEPLNRMLYQGNSVTPSLPNIGFVRLWK